METNKWVDIYLQWKQIFTFKYLDLKNELKIDDLFDLIIFWKDFKDLLSDENKNDIIKSLFTFILSLKQTSNIAKKWFWIPGIWTIHIEYFPKDKIIKGISYKTFEDVRPEVNPGLCSRPLGDMRILWQIQSINRSVGLILLKIDVMKGVNDNDIQLVVIYLQKLMIFTLRNLSQRAISKDNDKIISLLKEEIHELDILLKNVKFKWLLIDNLVARSLQLKKCLEIFNANTYNSFEVNWRVLLEHHEKLLEYLNGVFNKK